MSENPLHKPIIIKWPERLWDREENVYLKNLEEEVEFLRRNMNASWEHPDEDHNRRLAIYIFNKIFKKIDGWLEHEKLDIQQYEFFCKEIYASLWSCPTHASLQHASHYFEKWQSRYQLLTLPPMIALKECFSTVSNYRIAKDQYKAKFVIEYLDYYLADCQRAKEIAVRVKAISDSSKVKAEKEYWLRQLRAALRLRGSYSDFFRLDFFAIYEQAKEQIITDYLSKYSYTTYVDFPEPFAGFVEIRR